MNATILELPCNQHGRDFVVGDLHGEYDLLLEAMKSIAFDPATDRLLCVGDLIDRGPGSHRVSQFLSQPYVYSVRGNHEDELLSLYQSGTPGEDVLQIACRFNGLDWWLNVSPAQRRRILDVIAQLPLLIEVETQRGTVGLIHADVPQGMSWVAFKQALIENDPAAIQTCLWGRSRVKHGDQAGVQGIGRVFVGHTPHWGGIQRYGNVWAIDTGATFGSSGRQPEGHLTLANVLMKTSSLGSPRENPLRLIEIKNHDLAPHLPFCASSLTSVRA